MRRWQCNHLIGLAWLAMAAFDTPHDKGTLIYAAVAGLFFGRSLLGYLKERNQ